MTDAIAGCMQDRRDSRYVKHDQCELIRQRVYQIAMGYEDCNDANMTALQTVSNRGGRANRHGTILR